MEKYHLQFVIISREPLNCFIYFFSSFESYCYADLLVQLLQIDHLLLDADLDLILKSLQVNNNNNKKSLFILN